MRKKFKNILKLFALGTVFVLGGCEAEKDFAEENTQQKTGTIMHKKFEQLIQETQFRTAFNKIYKQKKDTNNTASRTVMENQYGFTIANTPANVIANDSITSYTFLINRPLAQPNVFENLIVSVKQNTEPEAFIIKYEGTAPINSDIPFDFFNFQGTKTLIPITYNATQVASKTYVECKSVAVWICPNHTAWEPGCTGYAAGGAEVCTVHQGSAPGGSSSSSSGSHGGGGSNGGTNTSPVVPCTRNCPNLTQDPCEKLNKLSTTIPTAQAELANLATKTNQLVEHGLCKLNNASVIQNLPVGAAGKVEFQIASSGQYTMIAHTHCNPANTSLSVFSWFDLEAIAKIMKQGKISQDCVFFLPTSDGTNYAMTIDDQEAFLQFFAIGTDPNFDMTIATKRVKAMTDYYDIGNVTGKPILKEDSTSNTFDEKAFMDMLKDNNMGASLLEADPTFTTFTKVSHNKTTGNIDRTPCN
jgi:hypothetical protein